MDTIQTATGKEINVESVSSYPDPPMLYIRVKMPLPLVAAIFGDPDETRKLTYGNQVLYGYTVLDAIVMEADMIRVNLRRE